MAPRLPAGVLARPGTFTSEVVACCGADWFQSGDVVTRLMHAVCAQPDRLPEYTRAYRESAHARVRRAAGRDGAGVDAAVRRVDALVDHQPIACATIVMQARVVNALNSLIRLGRATLCRRADGLWYRLNPTEKTPRDPPARDERPQAVRRQPAHRRGRRRRDAGAV